VNDIAEGLTAQAEPEPLCESATQQLTLMLDRITATSPDAADANVCLQV